MGKKRTRKVWPTPELKYNDIYRAIELHEAGYNYTAIGKVVGVSEGTIRSWLARFFEEGNFPTKAARIHSIVKRKRNRITKGTKDYRNIVSKIMQMTEQGYIQKTIGRELGLSSTNVSRLYNIEKKRIEADADKGFLESYKTNAANYTVTSHCSANDDIITSKPQCDTKEVPGKNPFGFLIAISFLLSSLMVLLSALVVIIGIK